MSETVRGLSLLRQFFLVGVYVRMLLTVTVLQGSFWFFDNIVLLSGTGLVNQSAERANEWGTRCW
jgi:hypothetical protein